MTRPRRPWRHSAYRELDRCNREIAEIEAELRAGNPNIEGLVVGHFSGRADAHAARLTSTSPARSEASR